MVAVTRTSSTVAGMTKVYTAPEFRGQGCAERLVNWVCQRCVPNHSISNLYSRLLFRQFERGMKSVVLFVGHTLAAKRVYHRVGFVGLDQVKSPTSPQDVENWLELGFYGTRLGHW